MKKTTLLLCALAYMLMGTLSVNAQWQQTTLSGQYVLCLVVSGTNIFAGTLYNGVFISTNNGISWTGVNNGLPDSADVISLAITGNNIFAGTSNGMFLSINNGINWTEVDNGDFANAPSVTSLAVMGTNVFAGTPGGIYLSNDTGLNWMAVDNGITGDINNYYILSFAVSGTNVFAGTSGGGIFFSIDTGASWTAVNNGFSFDSAISLYPHITSLAISGTNIFAGTDLGGGVFSSTNNGGSWVAINGGIMGNHAISSLEVTQTNIFTSTVDDGVFLSSDTGSSWSSTNEGLTNLNVTSLAANGTSIFAGTYGNGVFKRSLSDILGVKNISADNNDFTIYPNPATNQLTIHPVGWSSNGVNASSLHSDKPANVFITNVLGQETSPPAPLQMERGDAMIDISKLAAGIYFLQLKWESGSVVKKFVKE